MYNRLWAPSSDISDSHLIQPCDASTADDLLPHYQPCAASPQLTLTFTPCATSAAVTTIWSRDHLGRLYRDPPPNSPPAPDPTMDQPSPAQTPLRLTAPPARSTPQIHAPVWSSKEVPVLSADAANFQQWRTTVKAAIEAYEGTELCTRALPAERVLSKQFKFFLTRVVDQAWHPYIEDRECHEAWKSLMLLNPRTEEENDRQV